MKCSTTDSVTDAKVVNVLPKTHLIVLLKHGWFWGRWEQAVCLCVRVCMHTCMNVYRPCLWGCPQRPDDGVRSPRPGVTGGYKTSSMGAGTQIQALWKSSEFTVIAKPSVSPHPNLNWWPQQHTFSPPFTWRLGIRTQRGIEEKNGEGWICLYL